MQISKNISHYLFGRGAFSLLGQELEPKRRCRNGPCVFFVDRFFEGTELLSGLPLEAADLVLFVATEEEPITDRINALYEQVKSETLQMPCAVVGIGGGITLDTAKAISNLLTNGGRAEDYQGWDLVRVPGVFKVGVPTISGTGAEASRTCVMTNRSTGLKLGMNSDYTLFDQLVLDPDLPATVPQDQYFFTGMDTYIHCIESLGGRHRHPVGDSFSDQALKLSREVFLSGNMQSEPNREKLMVASYLGGCAVANSFVGVVHPFSAGLGVVLGLHHGIANCVAMMALGEFYPREVEEFQRMAEMQGVKIPEGVCKGLTDEQFEALYQSTIIHEKPLANALGENFKAILTREKVAEIFSRM